MRKQKEISVCGTIKGILILTVIFISVVLLLPTQVKRSYAQNGKPLYSNIFEKFGDR